MSMYIYIRIYMYINTVAWFLCFYGISTFVGFLMPNPFFIQIISMSTHFNCQKHFDFRLFSLYK